MQTEAVGRTKPGVPIYLELLPALALLVWAYWPPLVEMYARWNHEPQYSHGNLVPVFSLFVLWTKRRTLFAQERRYNFWGIPVILAAVVLRLAGTYFYYRWLDPFSLLPMLAGVALLFGGWPTLRQSWPAVAFLFFMIPLPHNVSILLAAPLQRIATEASTFSLQVLGYPAVAEGNVILLNEFVLGVVEACSGLRMLVVFFALATAVAMYLNKSIWEKCAVVVSAIPIALVANVLRITVTGVLYVTAGKEFAEKTFHDLVGWFMMPVALALLAAEIALMNRLFLKDQGQAETTEPVREPQVFAARVKRNRVVGQRGAAEVPPANFRTADEAANKA